jgi:MoaA/NifB/PqqE/SkfB family radical SAM enzyme
LAGKNNLHSALQSKTIEQMLKLATSDNKKSILLAAQLAKKITPAYRKREVDWVIDQIREDKPTLRILRHVARDLNPTVRQAVVKSLVVNGLLQASSTRAAFTERTGAHTPIVLLISPTMRCNLACEGCFASEYSIDQDLPPEKLQDIVKQANDIGIFLFTILGGEPFIRPDILDLAANNPDSFFQIYTNGTLLNDAIIERLAKIGNVAPMLSLEGDREFTDMRRGEGVYDLIMETMDKLGKAGVAFGYSATIMRRNFRYVMSDEFVEALVAKGAIMGWNFLYMPVGREPDMDLMLTAEERNEFREGVLRVRAKYPVFAIDFWGDATLVGGCIAARWYLHITSEGWVEPCVFAHYATHNINTSTLEEALTAPYFTEIRKRQPFNHNLLMPCMLIDNPYQSREIIALTGAHPTHPGAESMFEELVPRIDAYAAEVNHVYSEVWSCISHDPLDTYTKKRHEDGNGHHDETSGDGSEMSEAAETGEAPEPAVPSGAPHA